MSVSLSYDDTLSRVRATGTVPGLNDAFTRVTASGWGTATSGQTWSVLGTASDYSTSGTVGRQSNGTVNAFRASVLATSIANADITVSLRTAVLPLGASQLAQVCSRWIDSSNFLAGHIDMTTTGVVNVALRKVVAGVTTVITTGTVAGYTHLAGAWLKVRFQTQAATFRLKVWSASAPEPEAWTLTTTDAALPGAGAVALRSALATSNTNTLPVAFEFDDLSVGGPGVLSRSRNQITWETVRGGGAVTGPGQTYQVDDYEFAPGVVNYYRMAVMHTSDTASITPAMTDVWIKNLARPFLNRRITVTDWGDVNRPSREGVFEIVGRSRPLAVTDLRLSRVFELSVVEATPAAADELALCLSGGDPVLIHVPPDCPVPSLYAVIGALRERHRRPTSQLRYFDLPLTEVATPGPDVIGQTMTWQTVVNTYATWTALIAAKATWQDVLNGVSAPVDVIVP